ncbi:MAG: RimK family alpha-L-glutamate ligase [Azospirillum sp.]|nr:RimK family alpha-L-glutamate ligase [Azospirillum sp.]
MASDPEVVVFTDQSDWHTAAVLEALDRRGVAASAVNLADCAFAIGDGRPGVALAGCGGRLPRGVLVRTIGRGSFEQVTLRLGLLHALAALGVVVCNSARAIERCVDKSMTSFLLARAGLPTPATWAGESPVEAQDQLTRAETDLVAKPLFGSRGRGLRRLAPRTTLPDDGGEGGVWYLQNYVGADRDWHDLRALVIGDRVVAGMTRWGVGWVTNRHQGARCEGMEVTPALAGLAVAAARAVGAVHAGVDLIADRAGRLTVLEVNSMPAWSGLQAVTPASIADALAADLLDRIAGHG